MSTDIEIGRNIRNAREMAGMNQTQLAERLKAAGVPFWQVTISRIETGERPVRLSEAPVVARVLHVTVGTLLGVEDASSEEIYQEGRRHALTAMGEFVAKEASR